jgi:ATP-dependent DNA helicase RecQ
MPRTELHAGYMLDGLWEVIFRDRKEIWPYILSDLCTFWVDQEYDLADDTEPIFVVLDNLVSRGLPTLPSVYIENEYQNKLKLTKRKNESTGFSYPLKKGGADLDMLKRAFCVIEPRGSCNAEKPPFPSFGFPDYESKAERQFMQTLKEWHPHLAQLAELQRPMESIIDDSHFKRQDVDFAIKTPPFRKHPLGVVIEVDGPDHDPKKHPDQARLDVNRDKAVKKKWASTHRIKLWDGESPSDKSHLEKLKPVAEHPYIKALKNNYTAPLWLSEEGSRILELTLGPIAVARIQKTLIRAIVAGHLSLDAKTWTICVYERDVPCGKLAIDDFKKLCTELFALEGANRSVPAIDVFTYNTPEFASGTSCLDEKSFINKSKTADITLDISTLARPMVEHGMPSNTLDGAKKLVHIRSGFRQTKPHRIGIGDPVKYNGLNDHAEERLEPFLQNIFRKQGFREKQVEVIQRTLHQKSTIALLPTGAGKSLTYQMPAILQPGITIVVDPLKSLMKDQVEGLRDLGIGASAFINSTLSQSERKTVTESMKNLQYRFTFISPERFMIQEFRNYLLEMNCQKPFAMCVIDEAHCVSEWGHDFRTPYLRLGANVGTFCKSRCDSIPILALTGTASYDVLRDVQAELGFSPSDKEGLIRPKNYERKNLTFKVIDVPAPTKEQNVPNSKMWEAVAKAKLDTLYNELDQLAGPKGLGEYLEKESDLGIHTGLIFCPHVSGKYGVIELRSNIAGHYPEVSEYVDMYAGSLGDDNDGTSRLIKTQENFKDNKVRLLVATKAFGMGIDKPNVRLTIHFNMPSSIESFYQEAGRAGRDRKPSTCILLHCNQEKPYSEGRSTVDKDLMISFHKNSFKGRKNELWILHELLQEITFPEATKKEPQKGIEQRLAGMKEGEKGTVLMGFENGILSTITHRLNKAQNDNGPQWTEHVIRKATEYTWTGSEFIRKLKKANKTFPFNKNLEKEIKELFYKLRSEDDTFKAVYRLSIIGLIEDYTIDYRSRTIQITIKKLSDEGYIEMLTDYIARYESVTASRKAREEILARDSSTVQGKCLRYLIDFTYGRIAAKRLEALNTMEQRAIEGKGDPQRFAESIYTYFDSKYYPELDAIKQEMGLQEVWQKIDEIKGGQDEALHLRGACDRLLEGNPNIAALLLLRSYASFILPRHAETKEVILEGYRKAWEIFKSEEGWSEAQMREQIATFFEKASAHDPSVEEWIGVEIINTHTRWLHDFANRHCERVS